MTRLPLLPLASHHPVGWAVLGVAGYLVYRAGKKSAASTAVERESLADRTIKGAMKTVYKAKVKTDTALRSTKEKYAGMWREAQEELVPRD
ncbi:MAG: hypothetical protein ACOX5Z_09650 [Desulfobulbus sp.]|jgi:hypothetical protein